MPFLYEFSLNGAKLSGVEIGFSHSRKWEEALDEIKFALPFYESDIPVSQYGLLEVEITEVDNFTDRTEIAIETYEMLIVSDNVSLVSQYGTYRHDISTIEYTGKLDAYIMSSLAKTRSIEQILPARFEITETGLLVNQFTNVDYIDIPLNGVFKSNVWLPPFTVYQTYFVDKTYTFNEVVETYQITGSAFPGDNYVREYTRRPTVFRYYNIDTATYSSWYELSSGNIDITFTAKGNYYIEYGLNSSGMKDLDSYIIADDDYAIMRFYFSVIDEFQVTIYELVNSVRQNVSKTGGIESLEYFDDTRIFDIDPSIVDYLKSVSAPQMYLEKATARQMLIFGLSYINALPRLEYGSELDTLKIEEFNLSTGTFGEENTFDRSANQNINQIGTRSYSPLNQVLPNNMDEPTTYSPSQDGYQQVRATNLQITDSTFEIKLNKEIYTPKSLEVYMPQIRIWGRPGSSGTYTDYLDMLDIDIPLTTRLINIEEWKLKYITDNFPTITSKDFWDEDLGLRTNMVDNLYWQQGANSIKISDLYGVIVNKTLIYNVIKLGIFEYLMLNMPEPLQTVYAATPVMYYLHDFYFKMDYLEDFDLYKDLRFRFSYLSLEDIVVKGDKEDTSQIDFYSEMRQNQDESVINIVRSSRKKYGNLQRTGNKALSFSKLHYSLSEAYEVGQKDTNKYTITKIVREFFANFFIGTYFITRYHNRESRQTVIDQTYRWKDNYANKSLSRHENYGDYLMIYPPSYVSRTSQVTKIRANDTTIKTILGLILGETITDYQTRASVALVRTDGMFEVVPETGSDLYGILTQVSAFPTAQGFSFTLGFDSNLVAGDGLVQRGTDDDGKDIWYNQAVRYTNIEGRFTRFGFAIMPKYELDTDDYETYPKITRTNFNELYLDNNPYFTTGNMLIDSAGTDSLVVDKDPLTGFKLTYQLNVLSYYTEQYILGQAFYSENFIVNNPNSEKSAYLYLYEDDTTYGLFEDLKVKDGYASSTLLNSGTIEYDSLENRISFKGFNLSAATSWAIGDAEGNLYIACNEGLNGWLLNKEHFRIDIKEIGNKTIVISIDTGTVELDYNVVVSASGHIVAEGHGDLENSYEIIVEATGHKGTMGHGDIEELFEVSIKATGHIVREGHGDISSDYNVNVKAKGHIQQTGKVLADYEVEVSATGHKEITGHSDLVNTYAVGVEATGHKSVIRYGDVEEMYAVFVNATGHISNTYKGDSEVEYVISFGLTGHKETKAWVSSNSTYWNAQDSADRDTVTNTSNYPNVPSSYDPEDYDIGFALRVSDGSFPESYTYYKLGWD